MSHMTLVDIKISPSVCTCVRNGSVGGEADTI